MKNVLLSLALISGIAFCAHAQERFSSVVFNSSFHAVNNPVHIAGRPVNKNSSKDLKVNRTTSGLGSWYTIADSIPGTGLTTAFMWGDTAAIFGGTTGSYMGYQVPGSGYYSVSAGMLFDPMDSGLVPYGTFIPPTSGYTIDSVMVVGIYGRPNGATYTDALKLTFVYGNGDTTSNMPFGSFLDAPLSGMLGFPGPDTAIYFPQMFWDTTHNTATHAPGVSVAPITYTFSLGPGDTSVANLFVRSYPVNIVVPAGNFTGMSLSFVSGDTSFPAFPAKDTVQYADGTFKHGDFQPLIVTNRDTGAWVYPPENGPLHHLSITDDFNVGYFKYEGSADGNGWAPEYEPNWVLISATGEPLYNQLPYILFHAYAPLVTQSPIVKSTVNYVAAYPNPANDAVTISFNLSAVSDVTISLCNMLGQLVYEHKSENTEIGKVVVNTADLLPGMYFYTVTSNGERNTGHVVVVR